MRFIDFSPDTNSLKTNTNLTNATGIKCPPPDLAKFSILNPQSKSLETKSKSLETKSKSLENDSSRLLDFFSSELVYFSSELKLFSRGLDCGYSTFPNFISTLDFLRSPLDFLRSTLVFLKSTWGKTAPILLIQNLFCAIFGVSFLYMQKSLYLCAVY